ncbi:MAG: hypothetical protein WD738_05480 [Pirellulales bacterium]
MAANQRHESSGRKGLARPERRTASDGRESRARRAANEMGEEVSGYLSRGASQFRDMTRDHEGTAVLVALAAGFGVGLMIGAALASSQRRPRSWTDRIAAEGLGRRLLERAEGLIPDALAERFGR